MGVHLNDQGEVSPLVIADLLAEARREQQRCRLTLTDGTGERSLWLDGTQVFLATSSRSEESLGQHLLRRRQISQTVLDEATERVLREGKRLGRDLIEMGRLDDESLWQGVKRHQRDIALKMLHARTGVYRREICRNQPLPEENIPLQMEIGDLLCEGLRSWMTGSEFWKARWARVGVLYIREGFLERLTWMKPYELHVATLVKRLGAFEAVLSSSELMEADTCRVLTLLKLLDEVSDHPSPSDQVLTGQAWTAATPGGTERNRCPFASTEEALNRFNACYEQIYRTLHKHLGPVAFTIMTRGVDEIRDNLPKALRHVDLDSLGRINPQIISRSPMQGHVYAVKKHLGVDLETQVWRWMNGGE